MSECWNTLNPAHFPEYNQMLIFYPFFSVLYYFSFMFFSHFCIKRFFCLFLDHFFECNTDSLQPSIYLKQILPKWQKMLKKKKDLKPGSPMILVVASSAVRSVELIRWILLLLYNSRDVYQNKHLMLIHKK